MERKYNPLLLWGLLERYAAAHEVRQPEHAALRIMVAGEQGCFLLRRGKLYWDSDPADDYWTNCDQDGLQDRAADLREVVATDAERGRRTVTWLTFEEFLAVVGFAE